MISRETHTLAVYTFGTLIGKLGDKKELSKEEYSTLAKSFMVLLFNDTDFLQDFQKIYSKSIERMKEKFDKAKANDQKAAKSNE